MIITPPCLDAIVTKWLASRKAVHIYGMDFRPVPNNSAPTLPSCIAKNHGTIFLLSEHRGHRWLLKKFAASNRPSDHYLRSISNCLPGNLACKAGLERKIIDDSCINKKKSSFWDIAIAQWLVGAILVPYMPGRPWRAIAEDIYDGMLELLPYKRFDLAINLTRIVDTLENAGCCNRILSAHTLQIDKNDINILDWDCFYHPSLSFEPATICGSMGYMPPFVAKNEGNCNPRISWCRHSDRFAMAVLIAEILTVNSNSPGPYNDGTIFSQLQLDTNLDYIFEYANRYLKPKNTLLCELFKEAAAARTFSACPSPVKWLDALKTVMAEYRFDSSANLYLRCCNCKERITITAAEYQKLSVACVPPMCPRCNAAFANSFKIPF